MPIEIERKFLVKSDGWMDHKKDVSIIVQGYLSTDPNRTIRVRTVRDRYGYLCIKGLKQNLSAKEDEVEISYDSAQKILKLCGEMTIAKLRYRVPWEDLIFEIDVFSGRHDGVIIAELELPSEDHQFKTWPDWLGEDVTSIFRLSNAWMAEYGIPTIYAEKSAVKETLKERSKRMGPKRGERATQ